MSGIHNIVGFSVNDRNRVMVTDRDSDGVTAGAVVVLARANVVFSDVQLRTASTAKLQNCSAVSTVRFQTCILIIHTLTFFRFLFTC